jgi:streptogramin lyase
LELFAFLIVEAAIHVSRGAHMRQVVFAVLLGFFLICQASAVSSASANSPGEPQLSELKLVAQLPAELPQRISGLAYDGHRFWVSVYLNRGRYVTLDPESLQWIISDDRKANTVIGVVAGSFNSPGGMCFVDGKLWVAGFYGDSFGSIDVHNWKVDKVFRGKQRNDNRASQSYSSMAYDGSNLWIVWHWYRYDIPVSLTQLLLKIDPATGKVLQEFPAPAGSRPDGTHALTWDGSRLWHAKDNRLAAIDPATGRVISEYKLDQLKRPSGLAWDGQALWISEFEGRIWRLPLN